jgi:hypothetical protein
LKKAGSTLSVLHTQQKQDKPTTVFSLSIFPEIVLALSGLREIFENMDSFIYIEP